MIVRQKAIKNNNQKALCKMIYQMLIIKISKLKKLIRINKKITINKYKMLILIKDKRKMLIKKSNHLSLM